MVSEQIKLVSKYTESSEAHIFMLVHFLYISH